MILNSASVYLNNNDSALSLQLDAAEAALSDARTGLSETTALGHWINHIFAVGLCP
jgi:hypothetical protein